MRRNFALLAGPDVPPAGATARTPTPATASGRTARASTRPTGRCSGIIRRSRPELTEPRPVHLRAAGQVHRLLPRLLRRPRPADRHVHLGDPQGAHGQPGGQRAAALGRPARHPGHPLPLLRRGRRHRRGGPRRGGHRHRGGAVDHETPRGRRRRRAGARAAGATPARSCGPSCATRPGATTPRAPAAIGPASDPRAVVDSDFRVHGTRGLRVVDASVFPRIPGFFIVTAIYMAAEKASAAILADAAAAAAPRRRRRATRPAARPRLLPHPRKPARSAPPSRRSDEHRDPRTDEHLRVRAAAARRLRRAPDQAAAPAQTPPVPGADYRRTPFWRVYDWVAQAIDHRRGWDKLPLPAGLAVLIGVRERSSGRRTCTTRRRWCRSWARRRCRERTPAAPRRPQRRRHLQRPRPPGDGHGRRPLRPQHPAGPGAAGDPRAS